MKRVALALLLVAPLCARADTVPNHPMLNDTFRLSLGGYWAESNTQASLGPSGGGSGVVIGLEDTLGLEARKLVAEASAYWRFAQRWRVDAGYYRLARRATRTAQEDITWGDVTYPAGVTVNSTFVMSDLRASVGYSFFRTQDKEIGLGLGLHATAFKLALDGAVGARAESVTAPLPVLALYTNIALTDRWALAARADWLSLSYDNYSGGVRSIAFDIVYQPFKNWSFGVGMHNLSLRLDVDEGAAKMRARMSLQGPAAFASFSF